ncbi:UNVERIFIED_CONTAM: hypothetical protein Slati_0010600 [Sesamum latifolium]|uniref:Uncharacterized protein n=1 Tax=Sesamum latifolium TaxID=2727402 RepID=A0AAW2Y692_9LAMI
MICKHCHKSGHNKDTWFKLHGVTDWYRDLTDQRRKPAMGRAYAASELQTHVDKTTTATGSNLVSDLMEALKIIQNMVPQDPMHVNFAQIDEMLVLATKCGDIKLSNHLTLRNVLLIPCFTNNLISVPQLCNSLSLSVLFLTSSRMLQDLRTKQTMAIGNQIGKKLAVMILKPLLCGTNDWGILAPL